MRTLLSILFSLFHCAVFCQIKFPAGFRRIEGENGDGRDDYYYTDGRYFFDTYNIAVSYDDFKKNDDSVKNYLSVNFGFPFHITKDGLCWGTGVKDGFYSYIVMTSTGADIELYSKFNDSAFSNYSVWLITTIREYKKKGKDAYFPIGNGRIYQR